MKRRDMMRSFALAGVLVPKAIPNARRDETIEVKAIDLAGAMRAKHGGEWRISLQADFVLISKI